MHIFCFSCMVNWYFSGWIGGLPALNDPTPLAHDNNTGKFVQLMRFGEKPPLTVTDSWSSELFANITTAKIFYWSRYFYANSSINITWDISINLFDKKVNLPFWFARATANDHDAFVKSVRDNTTVPKEYSIILNGYAPNLTYTMRDDGFYFLFLYNNNTFDTKADIKFNITNRVLNVSNPLEACTLPCGTRLPYNREGEVLILVSPSTTSFVQAGYGSANSHFTFHAKLRTRTWFFALILTFIAVGFILVEFIVCCFYTTCDEIGEDVPTRFREVWKCVGDSGKCVKKAICPKKHKYQKINSPKRRGWADDSEDI
eukprot:Phypoly_transcript_10733.p1 GENE.Phypoly_transcript_10733~~Phypoly_transcript_10733.p1  ORF type:complete len:316 (+),score=42.55 Phypoly_transcript_10733:274-1221(+)